MPVNTFFYSASRAANLRNFNALHSENEEPVMAALGDNGEVIAYTDMSPDSSEPPSALKKQFTDYAVAGTAKNFTLLVSRKGLTDEGKLFVRKHDLPETPRSILRHAVNLKL